MSAKKFSIQPGVLLFFRNDILPSHTYISWEKTNPSGTESRRPKFDHGDDKIMTPRMDWRGIFLFVEILASMHGLIFSEVTKEYNLPNMYVFLFEAHS